MTEQHDLVARVLKWAANREKAVPTAVVPVFAREWAQQAADLRALVARIEALESRLRELREALDATVALDDLLERRRTRENPEVRRIRMPDDSLAEGPVVAMFYILLDGVKAAADRARVALAGDAG